MTKLYFRYGAVGSAKTLNLLAVAHCYRQQGKKVLILKPDMDVRFGRQSVQSRAGLTQKADVLISEDALLDLEQFRGVDCVLVDECQFLRAEIIEQFRLVVDQMKVPVICYGLRTDFRTQLFAGAKRLMELADSIEEIKTTCSFCNRKGTINLKLADGVPTLSGPQVCLGMEETYIPCCAVDYYGRLMPQLQQTCGFAGILHKPDTEATPVKMHLSTPTPPPREPTEGSPVKRMRTPAELGIAEV
jgi:thymidine kinase